MDFQSVPEDTFWKEYERAFEKVELAESEEDDFRIRVLSIQDEISKRLKNVWGDDDEKFSVGDDWDTHYHVCAGIYSRRILSRRFLELVREGILTDPEPQIWTFHAAVESPICEGQFFLRNQTVVFPNNDPNFERLLSRKFALW